MPLLFCLCKAFARKQKHTQSQRCTRQEVHTSRGAHVRGAHISPVIFCVLLCLSNIPLLVSLVLSVPWSSPGPSLGLLPARPLVFSLPVPPLLFVPAPLHSLRFLHSCCSPFHQHCAPNTCSTASFTPFHPTATDPGLKLALGRWAVAFGRVSKLHLREEPTWQYGEWWSPAAC